MSDADGYGALMIDLKDNVATSLRQLETGVEIDVGTPNGCTALTPIEPIPLCHKIALVALKAGDPVVKYGEPIGVMLTDVAAGSLVHCHNMKSRRAALAGRA